MSESGDRGDQTAGSARRRSGWALPGGPTARDATELRWFADGPLPRQVRAWFSSAHAATEARCDRYLLDQGSDVGIKVRGGQTLELKVRRDVGPRVELADRLVGTPEEWRKWSPADDVVDIPQSARWTSVSKVVTKRRFAVDGTEVPMAGEPSGSGCEVEVTHVAIGSTEAWSFAFAAFGSPASHGTALRQSWRTLTRSGALPAALVHGWELSMGYPEWLAGRHALAHEREESHR